ncbi:MAG: SUMF1/EgtB/PvdO family nonheme iron enzyme [Nitrospirales bacterium]|nr:SUMF1/EgtB/PvdO family nonheme iron enzyme [Nitrospirales bacterium]
MLRIIRPSQFLLLCFLLAWPGRAEAFLDQLVEWLQDRWTTNNSYAVVIGINEYTHKTDLNYAVNDGRIMVTLLKSMGFAIPEEAILLRERRSDPIVDNASIMNTIARTLRQAKENDRVIIFYAGHGAEIGFGTGSEAYLLPSNYDPKRDVQTGVSFRDLVRLASHPSVKAKHILFILDACYAADALNLEGGRAGGDPEVPWEETFFKEKEEERFIGVLTAGGAGERVKEKNGHGVFTNVLVRALLGDGDRDGNGLIHYAELVTWLEQDVFEKSKPDHQNVTSGKLVPGLEQMLFLVPGASVRQTILGVEIASPITAQWEKRRGELEEKYPKPNLSIEENQNVLMKQVMEEMRALKQELKHLKEQSKTDPIPSAQKQVQVEARLRTLDQSRRLQTEITSQDDASMVLVPAGKFTMGSNKGNEDERPPHKVELDAFYIDQYEVTTARYGKFFQTTGRNKPKYWTDTVLVRQGDRPVVGVTWHDAEAYCQWAGKRLPTEAEWEKAARGPDERTYPWGDNSPSGEKANYGRSYDSNFYSTRLEPVGSYEAGKSPYGVYDMAGSVWEWVADWYGKEYYAKSPWKKPKGPSSGPGKVIRGGSWDHTEGGIRSAFRRMFSPDYRISYLGFRCAKTS